LAQLSPEQSHDRRSVGVEGIERFWMVLPPVWKRALDVTGAALLLVAFGPILLLVALLIKLVSRGPVLFKQERIGFMGRPFVCWKFRTMHVDNDSHSHATHLKGLIKSDKPMTKLDMHRDPRIIPMGKWLRQTGLDELPQLVNVIRGEMSLIGPRPCIAYEYREYDRWQRRRVEAMPGLTGLWQVSGKNRTTFADMMRLDIAYGRRTSLLLDLKILLRTLPAILGQVRDGMARGILKRPLRLAAVLATSSSPRKLMQERESVSGYPSRT